MSAGERISVSQLRESECESACFGSWAVPELLEVVEAAKKVRGYHHGDSPGAPSDIRELEAALDEALAVFDFEATT